MDKQLILAKQADAEARYNDLQEQRNTKQEEINGIDTELVKLQGEYAAYQKLLDEPLEAEIVDPATITPKEATSGRKSK